jgi:hypothetical protein
MPYSSGKRRSKDKPNDHHTNREEMFKAKRAHTVPEDQQQDTTG